MLFVDLMFSPRTSSIVSDPQQRVGHGHKTGSSNIEEEEKKKKKSNKKKKRRR
jgi:hypothetical protein